MFKLCNALMLLGKSFIGVTFTGRRCALYRKRMCLLQEPGVTLTGKGCDFYRNNEYQHGSRTFGNFVGKLF